MSKDNNIAAAVGIELARQLFVLMATTAQENRMTVSDCVMACGVAVKTLMVHTGKLPDDIEAEVLAVVERAFAKGLEVPRELVAIATKPPH